MCIPSHHHVSDEDLRILSSMLKDFGARLCESPSLDLLVHSLEPLIDFVEHAHHAGKYLPEQCRPDLERYRSAVCWISSGEAELRIPSMIGVPLNQMCELLSVYLKATAASIQRDFTVQLKLGAGVVRNAAAQCSEVHLNTTFSAARA